MFVRFTGGGIGHRNIAKSTNFFRETLLKLFDLNFNNDTSNDNDSQADDDNIEDGSHHRDSDAPEEEEWEDIQSDIDDNDDGDDVCTDFEDDGGECGADEEDELGFGGF
jgi:hypothetical protein